MISFDFLEDKEKSAVNLFCDKVKEKLGSRVSFIRIFGSKVKGKGDKFSDIDLFVLVNEINKETKEFISQIAFETNLKYDVVLSPIIYEEKEFYRPSVQATPFIKNVIKEGIIK